MHLIYCNPYHECNITTFCSACSRCTWWFLNTVVALIHHNSESNLTGIFQPWERANNLPIISIKYCKANSIQPINKRLKFTVQTFKPHTVYQLSSMPTFHTVLSPRTESPSTLQEYQRSCSRSHPPPAGLDRRTHQLCSSFFRSGPWASLSCSPPRLPPHRLHPSGILPYLSWPQLHKNWSRLLQQCPLPRVTRTSHVGIYRASHK